MCLTKIRIENEQTQLTTALKKTDVKTNKSSLKI